MSTYLIVQLLVYWTSSQYLYKVEAVNSNKKILHSWYFCDAVYDTTNRTNLKFRRDRKILALTFLLWQNLKTNYFFKSVSIILYDKSMWLFSFIFWNYEYVFFSIFSHLMFCGWNTAKVISLKYFGFNYSGFLVNKNLVFNGSVIVAWFT